MNPKSRALFATCLLMLFVACHTANKPPATPVVVGPAGGFVGATLSYSIVSTDPESDSVCYRVAWGDGDTSDWSAVVPSGDSVTMTHSWTAADTYSITGQAKDQRGHESPWSAGLAVACQTNMPPDTPVVHGPTEGFVRTTLTYSIVSTDPESDSLCYRVAWGDGDTSDWSSLVPLGDSVTMIHSWPTSDTYLISGQAEDQWGHESPWSAGLALHILPSEYPDTVIATIPVGSVPFGPCVTPDGQYVYVPNFTDNTVSVVRTSDNTEVRRFTLSGRPSFAMPSRDGQYVYVTCSQGSSVARVRVSDNTVVGTIPTPSDPLEIALSPDGSLMYVGLFRSSSYRVAVVRLSDDSIVATPQVGCDPWGLAVTPDGTYLYVALWCEDHVAVLRTADYAVVDTIPVGHQLNGLAMSADGRFVYVAAETSNAVYVIRTSDNSVAATVPVADQPTGVAVLPNGKYVYVASYASDYVSVIRTSDNTVVKQIQVGGHPDQFAVLPDGSAVYVSVHDEGYIKVIGSR
jgi:YVTN family beta-propeller protein